MMFLPTHDVSWQASLSAEPAVPSVDIACL